MPGMASSHHHTRQDAQAIFGTLPFGNTLPMLWFANGVMRNLPQRD